jgi:hypothetical protein
LLFENIPIHIKRSFENHDRNENLKYSMLFNKFQNKINRKINCKIKYYCIDMGNSFDGGFEENGVVPFAIVAEKHA